MTTKDATADAAADTALTGAAPLYTRVEPLNAQRHGKLGVKLSPAPFKFASGVHFVPAVLPEFPQMATTYPIIFAGDDKTPLAVMGLEPGTNLFFNKDGTVRPDAYLPAYIRRFPFIVAQDDVNNRAVVCLDVGAELVAEDGEYRIFEGEQLTDYGKGCVDYCERFETDRQRSEMLLSQIKLLDLFHTRQIKFTPRDAQNNPTGPEQLISEFFAIEEPKLHKLTGDQLVALRDTGALAYIYSHLISMSHWDRMITMEMARLNGGSPANAA